MKPFWYAAYEDDNGNEKIIVDGCSRLSDLIAYINEPQYKKMLELGKKYKVICIHDPDYLNELKGYIYLDAHGDVEYKKI